VEDTLKTTRKVVRLYDDLIAAGEEIKRTCKRLYFAGNKKTIDGEIFESWKMNCLSLLKSTFGSSSPYYDSFANYKFFDYYNSTQIFLGILKGARKDVEQGYFFHKDLMLSVNIHASLIKRAREYIAREEYDKAQVILETTLMEILAKICENKQLSYSQTETLESFAQSLYDRQLIPESSKQKLQELAGEFKVPPRPEAGRKDLDEASSWILNFLDDYLGSQILILN
jgi:hypothetical protein